MRSALERAQVRAMRRTTFAAGASSPQDSGSRVGWQPALGFLGVPERGEIRPEPGAVSSRPAFGSILCAVDGSPSGREAARQAALLAEAASELSFVAVVPGSNGEPGAQAVSQAEQALQEAAELAAKRGVEARRRVVRGETLPGCCWTRAPRPTCSSLEAGDSRAPPAFC